MRLSQGRKGSVGFQMAPMADVVFLLLIFFMLITVLKNVEEAVKKLPEATEGRDLGVKTEQVIVNVTEDERIIIGKKIYELPELKEFLQSLGDPSRLNIYVRGNKEVVWDRIREVIKSCAEIGIADLSFGVFGPLGEEKG